MNSEGPKQTTLDLVRAGSPEIAGPGTYLHANPPGAEKANAGLPNMWRILRRHGLAWTAFIASGLLLGFLATILKTPVYRAHTTLEILSMNEDFLNTKQVSPVITGESNYETSDLQTQTKILQGETLSRRVIAKLEAEAKKNTVSLPARSASPQVSQLLHFVGSPIIVPRETALEQAAKTLKVRTSGRTRILDVSIDSPVPKIAADFANTLANEFIEQNAESRWKATQNTSNWLGRELSDMREKFERSENALQAYARSSGLIFTESNENISEEKLRQLQQELSAVTFDRITKQSRYELAANSSPDSLPDVLNDVGLRTTQQKLADLRRDAAELSTTYTPEYRKVAAVEAQIASLQATFDHDRSAILERIKNEYEEAQRKEKLLTSSYDDQTRRVGADNEKTIQYHILKREVDANRQLYDTMAQQLKSSSIASAMHASNAQVLDPADIPDRPFSPSLELNLALGFLAGALIGGIFILSRDAADKTLQDPGDAQLWTNTIELGFVPSADMNLERSLSGRVTGRLRNGKQPDSSTMSLSGTARTSSKSDSKSANAVLVADATRAVLTSILLGSGNGTRPEILVITSPGASEGKTTLTSNLGIALAEIDHRVLIIDADLRKPSLHKLFEVSDERGLSTFLSEGLAQGSESLDSLIQHTKIEGLDLLPSGPTGYKVTNLLYSPRVSELFTLLRKKYDMILIDTPPMLRMSDARILARMADGVILVTRARKTSRESALAANQRLRDDGSRVLGTVLNDWDPMTSSAGYSNEYLKAYSASAN